MWIILITALATLFVAVAAGLLLDYLRRIRSKVLYRVQDAVPITIDSKEIGAYLVAVSNPSKQTVADLSVHIDAKPASLRSGGVACTQGLQYATEERDNSLEVKIPFLKQDDEISITVIAESTSHVPKSPDVAVRSPQQFDLVKIHEAMRRRPSRVSLLLPALLAAIIAAVSVYMSSTFPFSQSQRDTLAFTASVAGLTDLAKAYALGGDVYYYHQGEVAYVLAKSSVDQEMIRRCRRFLELTFEYAPYISKTSKCHLLYHLGKIDLLLLDEQAAKIHFRESLDLNRKHVLSLIKVDTESREFIKNEFLANLSE